MPIQKIVAVLLASTAALASALTNGIKYAGTFTLQVQGNGPVSLLLADITSDGEIRRYAKYNCGALNSTDKSRAVVPRLLGNGHLAFIIDQGTDKNRCQGITELIGSSLAAFNAGNIETIIVIKIEHMEIINIENGLISEGIVLKK